MSPDQLRIKNPPRRFYLQEGTQFAHERGQIPSLEERGLELEGDAEDGDDDVGHGQVADVEVDHGVHPTAGAWNEKQRFWREIQKFAVPLLKATRLIYVY